MSGLLLCQFVLEGHSSDFQPNLSTQIVMNKFINLIRVSLTIH